MCSNILTILVHLFTIQYTLSTRINIPLDEPKNCEHVNNSGSCLPSNQRHIETVTNRNNADTNAFRLPTSATDTLRDTFEPSSNTDHKLSLAAKPIEINRNRRDADGISETEPLASSLTVPNTKPSNFLRLYFCGPNYHNCMYDERLNAAHMRQNVLERLPQMAEITLPTNYIDWKSKQLILPPSTKEEHEWPAAPPREPHYVLLRSDESNPQRLALLSGSELINDPFVPMRGRRFDSKALKDAFLSMRGHKLNDWDDPFVPMRGRKFDQNTWDDPFIPMRGRRRNENKAEAAAREHGSKTIPADLYLNDPFIPMRGRRSSPQQQQSHQSKGIAKRSLFDGANSVDAVYTPSEEVIVKFNGLSDRAQPQRPPHTPNRLIKPTNFLPSTVADGNAKRFMLNTNQHKLAKPKSATLSNDLIANVDDANDSDLMNDLNTDYYLPAGYTHRMNANRFNEPSATTWMDATTDLSSKRDANWLARGSATSFAI